MIIHPGVVSKARVMSDAWSFSSKRALPIFEKAKLEGLKVDQSDLELMIALGAIAFINGLCEGEYFLEVRKSVFMAFKYALMLTISPEENRMLH